MVGASSHSEALPGVEKCSSLVTRRVVSRIPRDKAVRFRALVTAVGKPRCGSTLGTVRNDNQLRRRRVPKKAVSIQKLGCALGYHLGVEVSSGPLGMLLPVDQNAIWRMGNRQGRHDCDGTLALPRRTMDGGEALLWRRDLEPRGAEKRLIELQSPSSPGEGNVNSRRKTSDGISQRIYLWMSRSQSFTAATGHQGRPRKRSFWYRSCGSDSWDLGPVRYSDWNI